MMPSEAVLGGLWPHPYERLRVLRMSSAHRVLQPHSAERRALMRVERDVCSERGLRGGHRVALYGTFLAPGSLFYNPLPRYPRHLLVLLARSTFSRAFRSARPRPQPQTSVSYAYRDDSKHADPSRYASDKA